MKTTLKNIVSNKVSKIAIILIPVMVLSSSASAHDPKLHAKKSEKANCSKMGKMDHKKMDMKDPVLKAMMKKCMKQAKKEMKHMKMEAKKMMNSDKIKSKEEKESKGHSH